jgi:hypothetical protein
MKNYFFAKAFNNEPRKGRKKANAAQISRQKVLKVLRG